MKADRESIRDDTDRAKKKPARVPVPHKTNKPVLIRKLAPAKALEELFIRINPLTL